MFACSEIGRSTKPTNPRATSIRKDGVMQVRTICPMYAVWLCASYFWFYGKIFKVVFGMKERNNTLKKFCILFYETCISCILF